jgi:DNA-binding PadR family transcriptional regulator
MTASGSAAHDGHDHRPAAADLFSIFGAPAAALARRPRRVRRPDPVEPELVDDDVVEDDVVEDDVPDRTGRRAPVADARPPGARVPRRRPGVVEVRDRRYVDLLLLAAATHGPASGHELIDLVRGLSDEIFALSPRVVVRELHRLTNDRLMRVTGNGRVRRYALTPLGERVLATRRREWEALSQGIDGVLDAADGLGGGRPARAE